MFTIPAEFCSVINTVISLFQSLLNSFFTPFSFLGISVPNLSSILSSVLTGCTAS